MRLVFLITLLGVMSLGTTWAQKLVRSYALDTDTSRYTLPMLYPQGEQGIHLIKVTRVPENRLAVWSIQTLDTNLRPRFHHSLVLEREFQLSRQYRFGALVYYLFRKSPGAPMVLFRQNMETGDTNRYQLPMPLPITLIYFAANREAVCVAGSAQGQPVAYLWNLETGVERLLPQIASKSTEVISVEADSSGSRFLLVTAWFPRRRAQLGLKVFNNRGAVLLDRLLPEDPDIQLNSAQVTSSSDTSVHLVGTFAGRRSEMTQGVYHLALHPDGERLTAWPLADMPRLFDHLPDEDRNREWMRLKRRREKKRDAIEYRFVPLPLLRSREGNIIMGLESYYDNLYLVHSAGERAVPVLAGYVMSTVQVCALSPTGQLLWQNSLPGSKKKVSRAIATCDLGLSASGEVWASASQEQKIYMAPHLAGPQRADWEEWVQPGTFWEWGDIARFLPGRWLVLGHKVVKSEAKLPPTRQAMLVELRY